MTDKSRRLDAAGTKRAATLPSKSSMFLTQSKKRAQVVSPSVFKKELRAAGAAHSDKISLRLRSNSEAMVGRWGGWREIKWEITRLGQIWPEHVQLNFESYDVKMRHQTMDLKNLWIERDPAVTVLNMPCQPHLPTFTIRQVPAALVAQCFFFPANIERLSLRKRMVLDHRDNLSENGCQALWVSVCVKEFSTP